MARKNRLLVRALFVGLVSTGLITPPAAHAVPVVLNLSDDATLVDVNGDGNIDSSDFGGLQQSLNVSLTVAVDDPGPLQRAALEFSLNGIAPGAIIQSVELGLFDRGNTVFRPGQQINVYGYAGDGLVSLQDGSLTSNLLTQEQVQPNDGDYMVTIPAGFIQGLVDSGASHVGFLLGLEPLVSTTGGLTTFCSSEQAAAPPGGFTDCFGSGLPPSLTVNFEATSGGALPEPGALALFGLGLAGLGLAARRVRMMT